jgi:hypothetical protein
MIHKKRLTNAVKWQNPEFRKLPMRIKLFWFYLLDTCDHAGFWQVDFESARFYTGEDYSTDEIMHWLGDEIIPTGNSLWFIPSFVTLQYRDLSESNSAHRGVIRRLKEEGFDPKRLPKKPKQSDIADFHLD